MNMSPEKKNEIINTDGEMVVAVERVMMTICPLWLSKVAVVVSVCVGHIILQNARQWQRYCCVLATVVWLPYLEYVCLWWIWSRQFFSNIGVYRIVLWLLVCLNSITLYICWQEVEWRRKTSKHAHTDTHAGHTFLVDCHSPIITPCHTGTWTNEKKETLNSSFDLEQKKYYQVTHTHTQSHTNYKQTPNYENKDKRKWINQHQPADRLKSKPPPHTHTDTRQWINWFPIQLAESQKASHLINKTDQRSVGYLFVM